MRKVEFTEAEAKRIRYILKFHKDACEQGLKDTKCKDAWPSMENELHLIASIDKKLRKPARAKDGGET